MGVVDIDFRKAFARFRRNRLAMVGLVIILVEVVVGVFAYPLAPQDPIKQHLTERLLAPGEKGYLLGTDDLGRDLFSRIIVGTQISLVEGIVIVLITLAVSIPVGSIAAYYPRLDNPIMRLNDVLLAFPAILLSLAVVSTFGTSFVNVLIAVALSGMPPGILFTRGLVLQVKRNEYVIAARALGVRDARIIFRHILPNIVAPQIVSATFRVATSILTAASLSFLGLGAQPPTPEWGSMLSNGRAYVYSSPHVAAFPGLAIMITVLGFNVLGDGLREFFDPRMRN